MHVLTYISVAHFHFEEREERITYIGINDRWFILVLKQLCFKICAVNLSSDQSTNFYTLHSVHSCCFKHGVMGFLRSI